MNWTNEGDDLHTASRTLGPKGVLHLQVESLGENGWDWHVWDTAGQMQQRYGLADTLVETKAKAEAALAMVMQQLGLAA